MTDRELLELAAKAAGFEYECTAHTGYPENDQHQIRDWFDGLVDWNPLENDGDALRLAVKLCLFIQINTASATAWLWRGEYWFEKTEDYEKDMSATTRRAIVRAAAEIGRNMK
jgi:hypothetical protein